MPSITQVESGLRVCRISFRDEEVVGSNPASPTIQNGWSLKNWRDENLGSTAWRDSASIQAEGPTAGPAQRENPASPTIQKLDGHR
jgi:hypothetical protein